MQRDSIAYIVGFAALVCVVCALLVTGSAVSLNEEQRANRALDRQVNVLYAAGLAAPGDGTSKPDLSRLFSERVRPVAIDMKTGQPTENVDAATFDMERSAADQETGIDAPPNMASIKRLPKTAVIYEVLGESGEVEMVVLPIKGYGLWSTLYGFLAVGRDGNTVRGITYYQHGETPGLGGEVDNPRWKALWPGRQIYNDEGEVALSVIKGSAGPPSADPYRVDGLSGATITSRGVSNMIHFWLGENGFGPYLESFRG